jgi:hypothetical protein
MRLNAMQSVVLINSMNGFFTKHNIALILTYIEETNLNN